MNDLRPRLNERQFYVFRFYQCQVDAVIRWNTGGGSKTNRRELRRSLLGDFERVDANGFYI